MLLSIFKKGINNDGLMPVEDINISILEEYKFKTLSEYLISIFQNHALISQRKWKLKCLMRDKCWN